MWLASKAFGALSHLAATAGDGLAGLAVAELADGAAAWLACSPDDDGATVGADGDELPQAARASIAATSIESRWAAFMESLLAMPGGPPGQ
jgi:hypothetical protein